MTGERGCIVEWDVYQGDIATVRGVTGTVEAAMYRVEQHLIRLGLDGHAWGRIQHVRLTGEFNLWERLPETVRRATASGQSVSWS